MRSAAVLCGLGLLAAGSACSGGAPPEVASDPGGFSDYSGEPDAVDRMREAARYVGPPPAPPRGLAFDAEHYEVRAVVDPAGERMRASARIWLRRLGAADTLRLKAGDGLLIQRVEIDDEPIRAVRGGGELILPLPPASANRPGIVVALEYEAPSRRGLRISEEAAFTYFHTDSWLPVHGDLDDRATIDVMLETPGWRVVGPGTRAAPPGWRYPAHHRDSFAPEARQVVGTPRRVLMEPTPPYLFGFATAPLQQVYLEREDCCSRMSVLVDSMVPEADIRRAFRDAWRMVDFLEEKAGIPFPTVIYRQVLLPDAPPQELLDQTLLPLGYLGTVLADSTEDYLIIHELAHQWWGTRVLAADWSHFWLQEGVVSYLVAAWKEERWGAAAYDREIRLSHERVLRAREIGPPRALVDSAFATSETAGGTVPYSMGLLVLHELRRELGDAAFWEGLRRFTVEGFRAPAGVTTQDLQRAMEGASGRELGEFFGHWVHARNPGLRK